MTIEQHLRQRAKRSRILAAIALISAVIMLCVSFVALPRMAQTVLSSVVKIDGVRTADLTTPGDQEKRLVVTNHVFTLFVVGFGVGIVGFAAYLLSRGAMHEAANAARLNSLADAICLCSNQIAELERIAPVMLTPAPTSSRLFSPEDLKLIASAIRPK